MGETRDKVLITGFGPFPGVAVNASTVLVKRLAQKTRWRFQNCMIVPDILDTEWERAPQRVEKLIRVTKPVLALHFGVARNAEGFRIEQQAANACRLAEDAAGALPDATTLAADGPPLRAATIDTAAVAGHLRELDYPATLSEDAGAYLCNAVFYASLEACARHVPSARVGFIHIPEHFSAGLLDEDRSVAGAIEILTFCLAQQSR